MIKFSRWIGRIVPPFYLSFKSFGPIMPGTDNNHFSFIFIISGRKYGVKFICPVIYQINHFGLGKNLHLYFTLDGQGYVLVKLIFKIIP
ncbi:hypothetical protein D3C87_1956340 [compost metagenome]